MHQKIALILIGLSALAAGCAAMPKAPLKTEEAIRSENTGVVGIKYLLAEDGSVADCQIVTSSRQPQLDDRACTMVRTTWKFKPRLQDGKPVAAWIDADVNFSVK